MKLLTALGISIGVLAGVFTFIASSITNIGSLASPLVVWVGFAAWACHYAAGGKTAGLLKAMASNVSGLVWGWLIVLGATAVGGSTIALAIAVAIAAFGMCVQANWSVLAFIPGTFVGAACFFGNNTLIVATLISLIVGALFGYASEVLGGMMVKSPSSAETEA